MAIQVLSETDQIKIMALLTGKTPKQISTSTNIEDLLCFFGAFPYLNEEVSPETFNEFPKSVTMGHDHLIFPFVSYANQYDLGQADVGQVEDMILMIQKKTINPEDLKDLPEDEKKIKIRMNEFEVFTYLVAIYCQKILDHEYDGEKAMALLERVKEELSFKEVVSMGYFFLNRLNNYMNGSPVEWQKHNSKLKRLKRGLQNLIQRLVSVLPSI